MPTYKWTWHVQHPTVDHRPIYAGLRAHMTSLIWPHIWEKLYDHQVQNSFYHDKYYLVCHTIIKNELYMYIKTTINAKTLITRIIIPLEFELTRFHAKRLLLLCVQVPNPTVFSAFCSVPKVHLCHVLYLIFQGLVTVSVCYKWP